MQPQILVRVTAFMQKQGFYFIVIPPANSLCLISYKNLLKYYFRHFIVLQ
jgi:hypothetical protein